MPNSVFTEEPAKPRGRDNLFVWTVFLLLLAALVFACWLGSFYVFGHPEKPRAYRLLQRLGKLAPPTRFAVIKAPPGEFLEAQRVFERYSKYTALQMQRENELLFRNYLRNYAETKKLVPYLTGKYVILRAYQLQKSDLFNSGVVILTQSVDFPQLVAEVIYPTSPENVPDMLAVLQPGLELRLQRTLDLSAIIQINHALDGRLQLSVVPLLYGNYALKNGVGSFSLEPPTALNVAAGFPLVRGEEVRSVMRENLRRRTVPTASISGATLPAVEIVRVDASVSNTPPPTQSLIQSKAETPALAQSPAPPFNPHADVVPSSSPSADNVRIPASDDPTDTVKHPITTQPTPRPMPETVTATSVTTGTSTPPIASNSKQPKAPPAPLSPSSVSGTVPSTPPKPSPPQSSAPQAPNPTVASAPKSILKTETPPLKVEVPPNTPAKPPAVADVAKITPKTPPLPPSAPPAGAGTTGTTANNAPVKPFIAASPVPSTTQVTGSWKTYSSGRQPSGKSVTTEQATTLQGRNDGSPMYLHGRFTVTAAGTNRAVLRQSSSSDGRTQARVIVEYPAGFVPPRQGASVSKDDGRGFEIREVRRTPDGQINIYVREVSAP